MDDPKKSFITAENAFFALKNQQNIFLFSSAKKWKKLYPFYGTGQ